MAEQGIVGGVDRRAARQRVLRLLRIPGKSGDEAAVQAAIRDELRSLGVPAQAMMNDQAHRRSPYGGAVGNLIVHLAGTMPGPRRLLMAHVDTVPLCVGAMPVETRGVIRAKSSETALGGDNRAGASVILTAACEILRRKLPHPPLTLLWPVQEEVGLVGVRYISRGLLKRPRLCFNWDGSAAEAACLGATGAYDLQIEVGGIASHAGVHPEAGVNAIAVAALAIADLQQHGWQGLVVRGKETGTSNIGMISGGAATNVVPNLVQLRGEVRSHDPRFRERLVSEFRQAFERAVRGLTNAQGACGRLKFTAELKYESFQLDPQTPCVVAALTAIRQAGLEPETRISNGGLDANWLTAHGFPTVTLGCGQQGVHTTSETLDVEAYLNACRIALILATASDRG